MAARLDRTRRLKELISASILQHCRSELQCEEFSIEALIVIHVDQENLVVINIKTEMEKRIKQEEPADVITLVSSNTWNLVNY